MQAEESPKRGGKRWKGITKGETFTQPLLSVITVVFNSARMIEATIQSALSQTYTNIEYIVIDGDSTDGTLDIIRKYDDVIDYWISEPDKGIYDAMNKGIAAASGSWLNFLNSGDVYVDKSTIELALGWNIPPSASFLYSDVLLPAADGLHTVLYPCDHRKPILNHQGSIYRKSLHKENGGYLVAHGVTIADYLFFSLIDQSKFIKIDKPIALCDMTGVSQSQRAFEQKLLVDYLMGRVSKFKFTTYFYLYFPYRIFKNFLTNFSKNLRA